MPLLQLPPVNERFADSDGRITPRWRKLLQSLATLDDLTVAAFDDLTVHGADVASATTIDLDAATGYLVDITGTTAITGVTLAEGRLRIVRFTGVLTLTHGASLILPGSLNQVTAAGDMAILVGYASGVVRCLHYMHFGAWTQYTPTVTGGSGTFTTVSATGRYRRIGKTVHLQVEVTITTNGTAAGSVNFTLPFPAAQQGWGAGREGASTGVMVQVLISGSTGYIRAIDNSYPGGSGYNLGVSVTYEA